jgi:hypothetical protein
MCLCAFFVATILFQLRDRGPALKTTTNSVSVDDACSTALTVQTSGVNVAVAGR